MTAESFVMDASIFISYIMKDENEYHEKARKIINLIAGNKFYPVIPIHFKIEAGNVLLTSKWRNCVSEKDYHEYLKLLELFPATIDGNQDISDISFFADKHKLTMYDAAYLELAIRKNIRYLISFDKAMQKAAKNEKIMITLP